MDISIIIPAYNSEKTISKCIESILNSDFEKKFEIIVVNDGSTDKSIENISKFNVVIINQKNKGAAAARNIGVKYSTSDLILFVDSDVVFFKDTLKRIYDYLKRKDVDYVSVRYSKVPANNRWIHKYRALADYSYNYGFIFSKKQKPIWGEILSGGVEGVKKKVFMELDGFDENIKGRGVEREKFASKLYNKYNMVADGDIETMHHFPDFYEDIKIYFFRTLNTMGLIFKNNYNATYLNKNAIRVLLGSITFISFFISIIVYLAFRYNKLFTITFILFVIYFKYHYSMFKAAFNKYGLAFTLYSIIVNLFFCLIISIAGFIGVMKNIPQCLRIIPPSIK